MISHPDLRWKRCDIKTTNLLANVLAIEAAHRAGAFEAVLVDADGFVTEATHTSLLWVRGGRLEGTPEGHEILPGHDPAARPPAARAARHSRSPGRRVTLDELKAADEVILVGTTTEVVSIVRVDGGEDRPGPARPGRAAAPGRLRSRGAIAGSPQPVGRDPGGESLNEHG